MLKLSDNTKWIFSNEIVSGDTVLVGDYLMEIEKAFDERTISGGLKVRSVSGRKIHIYLWDSQWEDFFTDIRSGTFKVLLLSRIN